MTADATISSNTGAGNIQFDGTVDGAQTLTVQAGTGDVTISGTVGGGTALTGLTVTAANISAADIGGAGGVTGATSLTGTAAVNLTGTAYNTGGTQTYDAGGNSININNAGGATFTTSGDAIAFNNGTVVLAQNLTVANTSGSFSSGAITGVGASDIDIQTADANITVGGAVTGAGLVNLNAGTATVNVGTNSITSTNSDGVTLDGDAGVTAGAITTAGGVINLDSTGTLQLNGDLDSTNGQAVAGALINFGGAGGNVQVNEDITVRTSRDGNSDAGFTLAKALNAQAAGTETLTLESGTAAVNVNAAVGATPLGGFAVNAGSFTSNGSGSIATSNAGTGDGGIAISASEAVTVGAAITSTGGGDISFASGSTGAISDIDLNAAVTGTGKVTFREQGNDGAIGVGGVADSGNMDVDTASIGNLTEGFSEIVFGDAAQTGAVSVNANIGWQDSVHFNAGGGAGTVAIGNVVTTVASTDAANVTVSSGSGAAISQNISTDGGDVTVNGALAVNGTLTVDTQTTATRDAGNVSITGVVSANGGLDDTLTIDASTAGAGAAGNISLTGNVHGAGAGADASDIAGLTVTGAQIDLANVEVDGTNTAMGLLATGTTGIDLNGTSYNIVAAAGGDDPITFTGKVDLDNGGTITVSGGGNAGDDISVTDLIDGASTLSLAAGLANIDLQKAAGSVTPLTGLAVTSGDIADLNSVSVGAGGIDVDVTTRIDLNGTTYSATGDAIDFRDPVDLASSGTITVSNTGGADANDVNFANTIVDTGEDDKLVIDVDGDGDVTFSGNIGDGAAGTQNLGELDVLDAGDVALQAVFTTKDGGGTGNITIGRSGTEVSKLTLNADLTAYDDAGDTAGTIGLYANDIDLASNITLSSNATADAAITIETTNDVAPSGAAYSVGITIDAGDANANLSSATFSTLDHFDVTASAVTLGTATLGDGSGNGGDALDVNTTGNFTISGAISSTGETNAGVIALDGVGGSIIVAGDSSISTNAAGGTDATITLAVVDGDGDADDLSLDAGSSTITLNGIIGATKLGNFSATAATVDVNQNITADNIDLIGSTTVAMDTNPITLTVLGDTAGGTGDILIKTAWPQFNGGSSFVGTGVGTQTVTFEGDTGAKSIRLGDTGVADIVLTEADLGLVASSIENIVVGISGAGNQIGGVILNDSAAGLTLPNTGLIVNADNGGLTIGSDVTLSNAGSAFTVNGATSLGAFAISTTDGAVDLDALTLTGTGSIDTNATGANTADITLGAVTGSTFNLTLSTGDNIAASDITGTSFNGTGDLILADVGGTASFTGSVVADDLVADNTVANISLTGTGTIIATDVVLTNDGTLVIGDGDGETYAFNSGLDTTGVGGTVTLHGAVSSTDDALVFGDVTLGGATSIDTNAATTAGDITLGAVTGSTFNLTLSTGDNIAASDITGTSFNGTGDLILADVGGTASFTGSVVADDLVADNTVANISLTGTGTIIATDVVLTNDGTLVIGDGDGETYAFDGGLDTTGVGGTVTLHGAISSTDDALAFGDVTLGGATSIDTNAATTAGDITLGAVTGSTFNLTLSTGDNIAASDITGTSFNGTGDLILADVGGTASFTGSVVADDLVADNTVANISLTGTGTIIATDVVLTNDGTLVIGDGDGETYAFNGGLNTTGVGGTVTLHGAISSTDDALVFGDVTLGGATSIDTNAATTAGDITLGAVTGSTFNLTLSTGDNIAASDITGTSFNGTGDLILADVGGTASFTGSVVADDLVADNTVANISLTGTGTIIATDVVLTNDGTLVIGDGDGETYAFNSGLDTTGVGGTVTLHGAISSSDDALAFGDIALGGATSIDTNAATTAGDITLGAVTGSTFNLTLSTGDNIAASDITGTSFNGTGDLILADVGGTASFTGSVVADDLVADNTVANISLTGTGTIIATDVVLTNDGTLVIGDGDGETYAFNGGLDTTGVGGTVTLHGAVSSTDDALVFGDVTLGGATSIDTNAATTAGDITLGAVTGSTFNLTLSTGDNIAASDITGTSFNGTGDLILADVGGTASFTGSVVADDLVADNTVANISLTGTGTIIATDVALTNDGTLVIGDGDGETYAFNGGLDTTGVGGTVTLHGAVSSTDDALAFGDVTLGGATSIDTNAATTAGDITLGAVTGSTFNLTLSTGDNIAASDITGTSFNGTGDLILADVGGTASFTGSVVADDLVADNTVANISLTGTGTIIATDVVLTNDGTLVIGDGDGETYAFNSGLDTTGVGGTVTLHGAISSTDDALAFGDVTLGGATSIDTNAATTAGDITLGAVTGSTFNLTLSTGDNIAASDITGTSFNGTGDLILADVGGTASFTGSVVADDLVADNTVANISLTGTGTIIATDVVLTNDGTLVIGDGDGETYAFNSGLDTTGVGGTVTLHGAISSTDDALAFGDVTLGGATSIDTNAATTAGDITLGAVTGSTFNLTLSTGDNIAASDITGTSFNGTGDLILADVGGTASFTGSVVADDLVADNTVANISLTGTGTIIATDVVLTNDGTLVIGDGDGETYAFNGGLDTTGVGGTVTLHGAVSSTDDALVFGDVTLGGATSIDTNAATTAGDITLGAVTGSTFNLTLSTGDNIAASDITGTSFNGTGDLILADVGGTASFTGSVVADDLVADNTVANISLTGTGTIIATDVVLTNDGTLVIGDGDGETYAFNGGLDTTGVGGTVTLHGAVSSSDDALVFGDVTLGGATSIDTNAATTAGDITLGAVTGSTFNLTLSTGDNIAASDITGTSFNGTGDLILADVGGTASFTGSVVADDLVADNTVANISLTGTGTIIATDVVLTNDGTLVIGDGDGETYAFNGGLDTTGVGGTVTLHGAVSSTDDALAFGDVTLGGATSIDTNAATTAGDITLGAVTGSTFNLTLSTGDNIAASDITGTSFNGTGDLILADVGGTASFTGSVVADDLVADNTVANISLTGTGTIIATDVVLTNDGTLVIGDGDGETYAFDGGLDTTGVGGTVTLHGAISSTDDALAFGDVTLGGATSIDTNAATTAGDITLGAVTGSTFNLTLSTGDNIAASDITGTSFNGTGDLILADVGGTASFTGSVVADDLVADNTVANISLTGTGTIIATDVVLTNDGTLVIGDGDGETYAFNGGLNTTGVGGTVTLHGAISSTDDALVFGDVTLGGATSIDTNAATTAGDITLGAVTGSTFNLTLSTGDNIAASDITGTSFNGTGDLILADVGGTASFTGSVVADDLVADNTVANISLTGTGTIIATDVVLTNDGTLVIGDGDGETYAFNGGLDTTGVGGTVTLHGAVSSSDDALVFGDVTLGGATSIDTNAATTAGDITLGAVTGSTFNLTLSTGDNIAASDITGTSFNGTGDLILADVGGTASFTGSVVADDLVADNTVANISLTGTGTIIATDVVLTNDGTLVIGDGDGETYAFNGGLDTTGVGGTVTLHGAVSSTDDALVFGDVTLGGATSIDTNAATTAGDITLGAVTGSTFNLTLSTGNGIADADINGTSVNNIGTLALTDMGGTATFTDAITGTAITADNTVANIVLSGTGNTLANNFVPDNTGTLILGQAAGTQTYNGGIDTSNTDGVVTLNGTIQTSGDLATFGNATLGSNTTIETTASAQAAGANITTGAIDGSATKYDLTIDAGTGGDIATGALGTGNALGVLTITNADDFAAAGTIDAKTVTTATDITSFSATGLVTTDAAGNGITITTDGHAANAGITLGGGANAAGKDIILTAANDIVFGGDVQSSAGNLVIKGQALGTVIAIGDGIADTAGSVLDMSDASIANINDNFTKITIGQTGQTGTVTLNSATTTFGSDLEVFADGAGATLTIGNNVATTANAGKTIALTGGVADIFLDADLSTNGGSVAATGTGAFYVDAADGTTRTIDTDVSGATGGSVDLSTRSSVLGSTGAGRLAIDTSATTAGGAVTLPTMGGGTGLNRVTITTTGATTDGLVSVSDITLTDASGVASQLNINTAETTVGKSIVKVGSTWDLSTSTDGVNGGSVDLGASDIVPAAADATLTINTSHGDDAAATADAGGNVKFGRITVSGGNYFDTATINMAGDPGTTGGDNGAAGTLSFGVADAVIEVDGTAGSQDTATVTIAGNMTLPATSLSIDTNRGGATANSGAIDIRNLVTDGAASLTLDTSEGNTATTAGNVHIGDIGATTPLTAVTVDTRGTGTAGSLYIHDSDGSGTAVVNVNGSGNIDFTNAATVLLTANTSLDTDAAGAGTNAGMVDFNSGGTIDSSGGTFSLAVDTTADAADTDADMTMDATVGGSSVLTSVSVSAADISITGAVTTTGLQTYTSTDDADTGIGITANLTADSDTAGAEDITLTSAKAISQTTGIINANTGGVTLTANSDATGTDGAVTIRDIRNTGANQLAAQGSLPGGGTPVAITIKGDSVTMTDIDADNITATAGDVEVYSNNGDILLGDVNAAGRTVYLEADTAVATNSITDNNDGDRNVEATTLSAKAADLIGLVSGDDIILDPEDGTYAGNALETAVTNLTLTTTEADADISIDNTLGGTLTVTAVTPSAGQTASMYVRNSNGISVTAWALDSNDNVGLIATAGNVTFPNVGADASAAGTSDISVGTGTVKLEAEAGTVADSAAGTIAVMSDDLIFKSGAGATLSTAVTTLDAEITQTGNLVVSEVANGTDLTLADKDSDGNSVRVADGNFTLTVGAGDLTVANDVSATDNTDNGTRAGLISMTVNGGGFSMDSGSITSLNNVDSDVAGGLTATSGAEPSTSVSVLIQLDAVDATREILVGDASGTSDATITADGGDILLDAKSTSNTSGTPSTGGNYRRVWIKSDGAVSSYNSAGDTATGTVNVSGLTVTDGSFVVRAGRSGKIVGSPADINITSDGLVGGGDVTLDAGAGNDVILSDTGSIVVLADAVNPGNLTINANDITMSSTSRITVDGSLDITATSTATDQGDVTLQDVTIDDNNDGLLGLGDAALTVSTLAGAGTAGDVTLNGTVTLNPVAGGTNTMSVTSGKDIIVNGTIAANQTGTATTSLIASGYITDGNGGGQDIQKAAVLSLSAADGIGLNTAGTQDALEISASSIGATVTNGGAANTGQINLVNAPSANTTITDMSIGTASPTNIIDFKQTSGDLTISNGDADADDVVVNSNGGSIDINVATGGSVYVNDRISSGGGKITIDPTDVTVAAIVNSAGGDVIIEADNDINFNANGQVVSAVAPYP